MAKNILVFAFALFLLASCGGSLDKNTSGNVVNYDGQGVLRIDGSSTVYPISEVLVEEFLGLNESAKITIGVSGTGGGFKKFTRQELDITGASRPISKSEDSTCKAEGIEYYEIPVAFDGLVVVVNPKNDWVSSITIAELKKIWDPANQGIITRWNQIRPEWPNEELHLFGAGTESGTFDYFTEAIVGKSKSCRGDYTASEDDNVLVQGISTDRLALGFFGYAYYSENKDRLKLLAVDDQDETNGKGAIIPTSETILNATYQPLSRPLFLYVNKKSIEKSQTKDFVTFITDESPKVVPETGYVPFNADTYAIIKERLIAGKTGSVFVGLKSTVGVDINSLLKK